MRYPCGKLLIRPISSFSDRVEITSGCTASLSVSKPDRSSNLIFVFCSFRKQVLTVIFLSHPSNAPSDLYWDIDEKILINDSCSMSSASEEVPAYREQMVMSLREYLLKSKCWQIAFFFKQPAMISSSVTRVCGLRKRSNPFFAVIFIVPCIAYHRSSPWLQTILPIARLRKSLLSFFHRHLNMATPVSSW